jgi:phage-related protein
LVQFLITEDPNLILKVIFYRSETNVEPVREWLKLLSKQDKTIIGQDIKTLQFGWPLGMPLVRKIDPNLWEIRIKLDHKSARIFFTVHKNTMILLHGFIKKTQKTPMNELEIAQKRLKQIQG